MLVLLVEGSGDPFWEALWSARREPGAHPQPFLCFHPALQELSQCPAVNTPYWLLSSLWLSIQSHELSLVIPAASSAFPPGYLGSTHTLACATPALPHAAPPGASSSRNMWAPAFPSLRALGAIPGPVLLSRPESRLQANSAGATAPHTSPTFPFVQVTAPSLVIPAGPSLVFPPQCPKSYWGLKLCIVWPHYSHALSSSH